MALIPDPCYSWLPNEGCEWGVEFLWRWWDWFSRGAVILLALMAANILVTACRRFYRYRAANTQSRVFQREATSALRDGRYDEVIRIAARNSKSPAASIVAEGIHAFASVPPQFTDREAVDAAERACQRAHAVVAAELATGLGTLRTIATLAPFLGLAGTCLGVLNAFREIGMQKTVAMMVTALGIAEALVMTALGLAVGILAVWAHNYLWRRVELLRSEMWQAETDILDSLKAHLDWRCGGEPVAVKNSWGFLTTEAPVWEISYDRQRALLLEIWACAFFLAALLFLRAC